MKCWTPTALVTPSRPWTARTPASEDNRFAQYNPRLIHERGYQVRFSSSIWTGIVGDVLRPLYAARQANRSTIRTYQFCGKIFYRAFLEMWLSVRPNLWFQYDGAPDTRRGSFSSVVKRNITWRVDWLWGPLACIPLLPKLTPMEFVYVWTPKGEFLRILS